MTVLHRRYPELIAAPTGSWIAGRAPAPARWLIRASTRNAHVGRVAASALLTVAVSLGRLRVWRPQLLFVVLLQRVGQAAGVAASVEPSRYRANAAIPRDVAALLLPPTVKGVSRLTSPASGVRARSVLAAGDDMMVVVGNRTRALSRAGYCTTNYRLRRGWSGASTLVPPSRREANSGGRLSSALPLSGRARRELKDLLTFGPRSVTVAARNPAPPAVLVAALGDEATTGVLVFGGGGPRRRPAFVVAPTRVVKVGRGIDAEQRAVHEQAVLARVHAVGMGDATPRPLGHGSYDGLHWSAETRVPGIPLADVLGARGHDRTLVTKLLERLHAWLMELGAKTSTTYDWTRDDNDFALAGRWQSLALLRSRLVGTPAVLQHGDLAAAFNVLVERHSFAVIDWETANCVGLPLADTLPLLCGALASQQKGVGEKEYVLRLCEGLAPESDWLFDRVRAYCQRVGVPLSAAGSLAALAWGRQASMQHAHRTVAAANGDHVDAWDSMWGFIADEWMVRPALGTAWIALLESQQPTH